MQLCLCRIAGAPEFELEHKLQMQCALRLGQVDWAAQSWDLLCCRDALFIQPGMVGHMFAWQGIQHVTDSFCSVSG